jgi:hypothetical protein
MSAPALLTFAPPSGPVTVLLGKMEAASLRAAATAAMANQPRVETPRRKVPAPAAYLASFGGGFALAQTLMLLLR